MSRLTIDVTDEQHQSLKALAALQGKTIKQYAIEKLFAADTAEDDALKALKALLERRLAEADAGAVDGRGFAEIGQAALRRDGPRE